MISKYINTLTDNFVKTTGGLYFIRRLYSLYEYFRFQRSLFDHQMAAKRLESMFTDLTVLNGPMAGLKYPSFSSFGSSLFPKLAGTYENELAPVIKKLNSTQ